jgi:hypothetical protein
MNKIKMCRSLASWTSLSPLSSISEHRPGCAGSRSMGRAPNPKSTQSPSDLQYQKQKNDPSNAFDQQAEPAHKAEFSSLKNFWAQSRGHPFHFDPLNLLYLQDYFPLRHRIRISNFEERTVLPHHLTSFQQAYSGTEYSIRFDKPPAPLIIPNYGHVFQLSKCDMMLSQNLILYCITRSGSQCSKTLGTCTSEMRVANLRFHTIR